MRVAVLGAAGMLGRKLVEEIALTGKLAGRRIDSFVLHDIVPPVAPSGIETQVFVSDFASSGKAEEIIATAPDVIFHLAAVVSGEAEADFDKGYRVNFDGTRALLEAIRRREGYRPRFVFTSSLAVFGDPLPDVVPDDFILRPRSSYGAQKAMGELLVTDYTRRGFVDGVSLRLPTICVRPGVPNNAASSFYSSIVREPLNGQATILPVPRTLRHWFASPRAAVGYLLHAVEIDSSAIAGFGALTMPGVSATVADQIEALRQVGGSGAVELIEDKPDPAILAIVGTWPKAFEARRALALGFVPDTDFLDILRIYVEDGLQNPFPKRFAIP